MSRLPRVLAFTPPRGVVPVDRVEAIARAIPATIGVALVLRTPGAVTPPHDPRVAEAATRARALGLAVWGSVDRAGAPRAGRVDAVILRGAAEGDASLGLWGRSVHLGDRVQSEAAFDCFAPVFEPLTDPASKRAVGLSALRAHCEAAPRPVYALGGIQGGRIEACLAAGAYGVAAIGAVFGPEADLEAFCAAVVGSARAFFG